MELKHKFWFSKKLTSISCELKRKTELTSIVLAQNVFKSTIFQENFLTTLCKCCAIPFLFIKREIFLGLMVLNYLVNLNKIDVQMWRTHWWRGSLFGLLSGETIIELQWMNIQRLLFESSFENLSCAVIFQMFTGLTG